jgi:hypothetical protein
VTTQRVKGADGTGAMTGGVIDITGAGTYVLIPATSSLFGKLWRMLIRNSGGVDVTLEFRSDATPLSGQIPLQSLETMTLDAQALPWFSCINKNEALNLVVSGAGGLDGMYAYSLETER